MQDSSISSKYSYSLSSFFTPGVGENCRNLIYANIRSLRKNFYNMMLELSQIKSNISFIVLSETWINSDEVDLYNIQGYNAYHCCNDTYRAGGVICYVAKDINVTNLNIKLNTADTLVLKVEYNKVFFNLICLYRLHCHDKKNFIDEFALTFSNLPNYAILIGDINLDILDNTPTSLSYMAMLSGLGFSQFVDCPTHSKTCLDHIFIRHRNLSFFESVVFDIDLTDHCLLGLRIVIDEKGKEDGKLNAADSFYKVHFNLKAIKQKLKNVNWTNLFAINDVNVCFNNFHDTLCEAVNSCKTEVNNNSKLNKAKLKSPWINSTLLRKLDRKTNLFKIKKKRLYDKNFSNFYNRFCNNLKIEINEAKNSYYSTRIRSCQGDSALQWKIINEMTGTCKDKSIDRVELENGDIVTEPDIVAETINTYFMSVQDCDNSIIPATFRLNNRLTSFFILPTSAAEVSEVIKGLKNKKSSGFDNITTSVIKHVSEIISPILAHIANLCFSSGVFPEKLKVSIVIPIFKKLSSLKLDNLRPISLLSVFSKIFEKLMKTRLINYLNRIQFFSDRQFGFRKGKSTEDALVNVSDMIYNSMNAGSKSTGLFVDFKKAFDLVNHDILLLKMEAAGIRGVALNWFRSFLTGREQRVRVGASLSSAAPVKMGVPQGSVISATLFLVFINDLLELQLNGNPSAFADDVALFYCHKNIQVISNFLNEDLRVLRNWCALNKMQINVSKTKYVNFYFKEFDLVTDPKYHLSSSCLANCSCATIGKEHSFKYLGLTLDDKLSWEKHINLLHNNLKSSVRKFYFLRNFCSEKLLRTLYYGLVDSRLQYGVVCWGGAYKFLMKKLRVLQNHFIRIILKKPKRESSFPLFVELNVLPLQFLYVYKVLKLFYVRSGNTGTTDLVYSTRNTNRRIFRIPKVHRSLFKHSFVYSGPKFFNRLPLEIKESDSLRCFCLKVRKWLLLFTNTEDLQF